MISRFFNFPRNIVQAVFLLSYNCYFYFFKSMKLYGGALKKFCCPALNCYSCPLAVSSCPIGAIQAVAGSVPYKISFYVFSFLGVIGIGTGRFVCGWACPFGLLQDLIYRLPFRKYKRGRSYGIARYFKFLVLIIFVILMPAFLLDDAGYSQGPSFCKYICPAGTFEAGIPFILIGKDLPQIGTLFYVKLSVLVLILLMTLVIARPFCRYLCPLGAIYALFNRFSLIKISRDTERCIHCHQCEKVCPMEVSLEKLGKDMECIRCSECVKKCPVDALKNTLA